MQIYFNNELIQCTDNITVAALLKQLHQLRPGIALAINKRILPREQWALKNVCDGDHILLVQVIAGG